MKVEVHDSLMASLGTGCGSAYLSRCIRANPRAALGVILAIVVCGVGMGAGPAASADGPEPIRSRVSTAVGDLIESFDEDQKDEALYAFDDDERFDLRLAPLGLEGLRLDAMAEPQQRAMRSTLGHVLSETGLTTVDVIRSLEVEVAETEGGAFGLFMGWMRKVGRYFLAVFGDPRSGEPWGMRFDGHHLSLNWTVVPGKPISVTPVFLGGQPREVPEGFERAGLRVLGDEEDRAIELIASLDEGERAAATLAFEHGSAISRPMFVGDAPQLELATAVGVAVDGLDAESRGRLDRLVATHLENFTDSIAARFRLQIDAEIETLRFAYGVPDSLEGGSPRAGDPLYYRIQSRGFLIEFDDTAEEADHVHVVIRSIAGDFGRDVLAEHYLGEAEGDGH